MCHGKNRQDSESLDNAQQPPPGTLAAHVGGVAALTCFYGHRNENQAATPRTHAAHAVCVNQRLGLHTFSRETYWLMQIIRLKKLIVL